MFSHFKQQLGRVVVMPIDEVPDDSAEDGANDTDPVMLLALNSTPSVTWEELEFKVSDELSVG